MVTNEELFHYGVKGMKWGVRHDRDKTGRSSNKIKLQSKEQIKKKGTQQNTNNKQYTGNPERKGLTDKQKRAIKVGVAVTGTALLAVGAYKLSKSGKLDGLINSGKNALGLSPKIDPKTGFKLQSKPMSPEKNARKVNPNFSPFDRKSFMNCGNCTLAFESRMRGYDVDAMGNSKGMTFSGLASFFKEMKQENICSLDADLHKFSGTKSGSMVESTLKKRISESFSDDYARGALQITHTNGSHWINWIKDNGEVKFYDAQNPKIDLKKSVFDHYTYFKNQDITKAIRLDNLEINEQNTKGFVKNVGEAFAETDYKPWIDKGVDFIKSNEDLRKIAVR